MRHKVMEVLETVDNITVYDSTTIDWTSYPWQTGYIIHYITNTEILKPYFISYQYYNTVEYEDIIMLLNNIEDPWQLVPGSPLRIPNFQNLQRWILQNTK